MIEAQGSTGSQLTYHEFSIQGEKWLGLTSLPSWHKKTNTPCQKICLIQNKLTSGQRALSSSAGERCAFWTSMVDAHKELKQNKLQIKTHHPRIFMGKN